MSARLHRLLPLGELTAPAGLTLLERQLDPGGHGWRRGGPGGGG